MRYIFSLALATILLSLVAAPAFAGDGHVPQSTLRSLGLAGMQPVSDEEGMQVRGMSGAAKVMGMSLVTGLLIDPATNSYVWATEANHVMASAENAGCRVRSEAYKEHLSTVELSLMVDIDGGLYSHFEGYLIGGAGGNGYAWSQ